MKPRYRKHHFSLILSLIYSVILFTTGVFSYVTYAWFSQTRQAEVNFASISIDSGISFRLKYLQANGTLGYEKTKVSSITSASDFSYVLGSTTSASFVDATSLSDTACSYSPDYATSYAIEVTNDGTNAKQVSFSLTHFSSVASPQFYSDSAFTTGIALSQAMRVYSATSLETSSAALTTAASAFMNSSSLTNHFTHSEGTPSTGTTLASPESWLDNDLVLPGGATGVIFLSFYFSNASDTFYSYSATKPDDATKFYYVLDQSGDSNVYKGLSIAFSQLSLSVVSA